MAVAGNRGLASQGVNGLHNRIKLGRAVAGLTGAARPSLCSPRPAPAGHNYLHGLLAQLERKNGWQLAEQAGDATPDGVQRLLGPAQWSADAVRDELVRYAQEHLLAQGERGTLIVDETGFLKKGQQSVGSSTSTAGQLAGLRTVRLGCFWPCVVPGGIAC